MKKNTVIGLFCIGFALGGCAGPNDRGEQIGGGDAGADQDIDSGSDTDAGGDSDPDTGADADADGDGDADTDADGDSDIDAGGGGDGGGAIDFVLSSPAFEEGGELPVVYTCDGAGLSPPLAWTGVPEGTVEFALMMTTVALDGLKWNWVLFHIPGSARALAENTAGVGTVGLTSDGPELRYYPPCSKGPGAKTYTFTIYALSGTPTFAVPDNQVNGAKLTDAIGGLTIATAAMSVTRTR